MGFGAAGHRSSQNFSLHYAMLCCASLCCAVLYCTVLYYTTLCYVMPLCCAVLHHVMLCYAIPHYLYQTPPSIGAAAGKIYSFRAFLAIKSHSPALAMVSSYLSRALHRHRAKP